MGKRTLGQLSAIGDHASFLRDVDAACIQAQENITDQVAATGNRPVAQAQGNYAEAHHAETFNVDAVLNRMDDVRARVLNSNGYKSTDIVLEQRGQAFREYGLKYYKSGKESVDAQKGYPGQERLIPEDQLEAAREYIQKQTAKDQATGRPNRLRNAEELERIEDRLTGRVSEGRSESEALGRKEASEKLKEARREGKAEKPDPQIDGQVIGREALRSGVIAAGITAGMAAAPRIYEEFRYWRKERAIRQGALRNVLEEPARLAAESGVRGAMATSLTLLAKKGAFGEAAQKAGPPLIGALTYMAVEGGKDLLRYRKGDLSGDWFADGMMRKSLGAASGAYGAALGQVVIPIPVLGSMIGASLGSILAENGYQLLEDATDAFYRETQLRELAGAFTELSTAWTTLDQRFEYWLAHDAYYRNQVSQHERRQAEHDEKRSLLNQKLQDALNDDA
jgi:hypothetical protein